MTELSHCHDSFLAFINVDESSIMIHKYTHQDSVCLVVCVCSGKLLFS